MNIMIQVSISNDLKSGAVARTKELLIRTLMHDNQVLETAVIMRPYNIGPSRLAESGVGWVPDESTRLSR